MSPKLLVVSGEELIRALEKFGYIRARQKGSHVRLRHATDTQRIAVTVPLTMRSHLAHLSVFSVTRGSHPSS
jgi:predicted RNA binding protein YcfA (HicA-like mRNA interferase family)